MSKKEDKSEYVPFGEEWKKDLMRLTKRKLIELLKNECKRNIRLTVVRPSVYDLVIEGLKSKGYDGLHYGQECGCEISDLAPCGEFYKLCTAGYKVEVPDGVESEHDFWICDSKDDKPWEV